MKEIKNFYGYTTQWEADDGEVFNSPAECEFYEKHLVAKNDSHDDVIPWLDFALIFNCADTDSYEEIAHWAEMAEVDGCDKFTPHYIGKKVMFMDCRSTSGRIYFNPLYSTRDALLKTVTEAVDHYFAE